ncbi:MAG TPA: excinuclease ABC subunit C [Lentisphaeria bacterium]|nr:excinuclease ABC subunit C [Lentisphaeria bacterium]|tara:strand:+ start:3605 stop:5068 length:1464 start_codon:yes stop_codon:yes gene_type:complete
MTPKSKYRTTDIPNQPGVYVLRDRFRKVIYVGKAKSLRRRMSAYFQPSRSRTSDIRIRSLINSICFYEIFPVRTEEEALMRESAYIKQYKPRYNVVLRDDKRFLLIKIDINTPYPRITLARLRKDDNALYFGPFPLAGVLRETCDYLTRFFGLRACTPMIPDENDHRHCLDRIVRYCSAPCVGKVSKEAYHERVQRLIEVINGKTDEVVTSLQEKMETYASKQQYEQAARTRDIVENMHTVFKAQNRTFRRATMPSYAGDAGIAQLQEVLQLEKLPATIECFDISNIAGTFAVGSMVCFVDGAPAKKLYRHFRIKTVEGIDDFAMMSEVVTRRYKRQVEDNKPLPDLIVVDGGLGQLHAGWESLLALDLGNLPIIGLAKQQEEIFTIYDSTPILLDRHEASLKLLQSIRDEAHRFAITFHRELRRKRILDSMLDEIPGIGKKRRDQLLKAFGSVRNLRKYDADAIIDRVPGIGKSLADNIVAHLKKG